MKQCLVWEGTNVRITWWRYWLYRLAIPRQVHVAWKHMRNERVSKILESLEAEAK
jgi:hypothetical protein